MGCSPLRVCGVWRDYARQFGAAVIRPALWQQHGGDARVNDLALWLKPGAQRSAVIERLRTLAGADVPIDTASAGELRALSLAIFDRSFAVTRYLQIVAIAVGLIGVAASLSAQVLARRKEFGLLAHLGLTRAKCWPSSPARRRCGWPPALRSGCCSAWPSAWCWCTWSTRRASTGPCRFTCRRCRWRRLAIAVWLCGVATAALAARHAAARSAVLAVKEDW